MKQNSKRGTEHIDSRASANTKKKHKKKKKRKQTFVDEGGPDDEISEVARKDELS